MIDVQQVRAGAVQRVLARRRKPEFRTGKGRLGMDIRVQAGDPDRGEFLDPADASQWFDDRVVRIAPGLGPWTAVLFSIAEGARSGEKAAAAAVSGARALSRWDQWHLFRMLQVWRAEVTDPARPVMRAVLAEWDRLRLVAAEPHDDPLPPGRRVGPRMSDAPGTAYGPGVPDSMKIPGGRVNI